MVLVFITFDMIDSVMELMSPFPTDVSCSTMSISDNVYIAFQKKYTTKIDVKQQRCGGAEMCLCGTLKRNSLYKLKSQLILAWSFLKARWLQIKRTTEG